MASVSLVPMTQQEFDDYVGPSMERYKQDKIRANNVTPEEATRIAQEDFKRILSDGLQTKNNFLFSLISSKGENVGMIWYTLRGAENHKAFIAEIFINEDARGKGYGKAAMLAVEAQAKERGLKSIELHVFGFNDTAIGLYRSLGFESTDIIMAKKLGAVDV